MKKSELRQLIREEIEKVTNASQSMPTIQPSKEEYDKLIKTGKVTISRLSTGVRHSPSAQTYKKYPKGQYEIIVKNPYTKGNEVFFANVDHTDEGVYLQISKSN